jgi:hypothetical protein
MKPTLYSKPLCLNAALTACLLLLNPRHARAENTINYKYEDYSEADGRIGVTTQSALLEQDFGPDTHVKVQGVIDAIAGATPNGQPAPTGSDQVVLTTMHERRKAWNADFSRQFSMVNLDLGIANSRESDYISNGWSLNAVADFNDKNTTLLAGVAGTSDKIKVFYQPAQARKRNTDLILGANQLLDAQTSVSVNLSWGRATGYLSDPYKLVQKSIEVAPGVFLPFTFGENRPDERTRWSIFGSVNRAYPSLNGAVEGSYRFYHDTFGTSAHTIEIAWFQHVGKKIILRPSLRLYDQSAADFYHYQLDSTSIVPVSGTPNPNGPFFSSDYRLSALRSLTYGLKAVWTVTARWQLDLNVEKYDMHGRDSVTPGSAYPRATIVTAGAKLTW